MEPTSQDSLAALLADDAASPAQKIAGLRDRIRAGAGPGLRHLLRDAAALPANEPILKDLARAYGYTGDRAAIEDLAPLLAHENKSVVCNAVKALIDLDPGEAVHRAIHTIKTASPQIAWPVALVLARGCEPACREFFLGLTYSGRERDRIAALVYLRSRPPAESVPVIMDMLRRERSADVRAQLIKLIARRIARRDAQILLDLRAELLERVRDLDKALGALVEELDPSWVPTAGAPRPPLLPPAAQLAGAARMSASSASLEPPTGVALEPPTGPLSPTKLALDGAVPVDDAAPAPAPAPAAAPVAAQVRRPSAQLPVAAEAAAPRRSVLPWAIAGVVAGAVAFSLGTSAPPPAVALPVRAPSRNPLGAPGSRVEVSGTVVEVRAPRRMVFLKTTEGLAVLVHLAAMDVAGVKPGATMTATGVLKEFKLDGACVLEGLSLVER